MAQELTCHPKCQSENVVHCITCRLCTSMYIGETGGHLREHFSEHLRSIRNRPPGLPVPEHFNSANHTICRWHQGLRCLANAVASNTSQKRWEMQLIFELGTLKPGGLNINFFSFYKHALWLFVSCACALRAHFSVRLLNGARCIFLHTEKGLCPKRLCFNKLRHLNVFY